MKLSLRWLNQYLPLEYTPEEIADMLTTIGLEVEGWEKTESVKGGLSGVVVGHVMECSKHPDADKLSLTSVDIGQQSPLQIVCGAPNVRTGQKVLVATIGTTLYDKEGNPWKIKKGKIRGAESEGMICAEDELGLGNDHSGIMVLNQDAVVGMEAARYLNLQDDIIFEIGLTPNRSDATSHLGVAKDLYAYLKVNKNYQGEIRMPETADFVTEKIKLNIDVEVRHKEACPRYAGVSITGVQVGESPDWIKQFLLSVGVKPINNIVDITNFVLHELGQPLHAFDADKINGHKIIVDTLPAGTVFTSLDGTERKLTETDLMINDAALNPLCMGGVYGGLHSGVSADTTNIFLESAYFDPKYIRNTSTGHLLRTDAAKVFEKGADPEMVIFALKRAAGLIRKYGGASISNILIDVYPKPVKEPDIKLRYKKANAVIGTDISKENIQFILSSLGMRIRPLDDESLLVNPGTNKHDVTREIDIIEEILRIYGLNNIAVSSGIRSTLSYQVKPDKNEIKEIIAQYLAANQYHEMMGLSLIESKLYHQFEGTDPEEFVYINNTSNVHLDILRPDMLVSGLQSVVYNLNRQQSQIKLFEHGKSYRKKNDQFIESEYITLFLSGKNKEETWYGNAAAETTIHDLKAVCASILRRLGLSGIQEETSLSLPGLDNCLHFYRGNQSLIKSGSVRKKVLKNAGIKQPVFYAEINLTNMVKALAGVKTNVKEISRFPSMRRDLAMILDENVAFSDIVTLAAKADRKYLKDVRLFDVFKDPVKIGENKKSYAVSFHFENTERTLSDKEIDLVMEKIMDNLQNQLKANVRK